MNRLYQEKTFAYIRSKVTLVEQTISSADFKELVKPEEGEEVEQLD